MGSGRDKRKKAKGHVAGVGKLKTERKTEKNAEKALRRQERQTKGGDDDIDALLEQFKLQDEAAKKVVIEEDCDPPTARVYASFTPLNDKEIILFGGEWYDGDSDKMYIYADVYILNTEKMNWRKVISPGGPLPRTSHQAVVARGYIYVFGGEFTSLNQRQFKHYSDLWRLRLDNWEWEQLPSKGPSARSGHRMVLFKTKLILFGGFYDASKETRYYNDLWVYDLEELQWHSVVLRPGNTPPAPRGGCQLAMHSENSTMYVIGGYSIKPSKNIEKSSKPSRDHSGQGGGSDDSTGFVHDDIWALSLTNWQWERIKKAGMAPSPRISFGLGVHKQRAVMFGGVLDREGAGDRLYSELYNELYQFNFIQKRWYPIALRTPKKTGKSKRSQDTDSFEKNYKDEVASEETDANGAPRPKMNIDLDDALSRLTASKDSPLVRAATRIQAAFRGHAVRKAYQTYRMGGQISELLYSPAAYGIDLSAAGPKPRARSAPMVAVVKNNLWVWGGIVEISHNDVVLDDLWCLDLNKLDEWKCLKENTAGEDAFKELSDWETESE